MLEAGVGIRCNNLPTLAYKLDRLLSDRRRFAEMRRITRKLARPHAASEIVQKLFELDRGI